MSTVYIYKSSIADAMELIRGRIVAVKFSVFGATGMTAYEEK